MMQDKVIEIIVYILSEIKEIKQLNDINISSLTDKGYSDSEINTAFAWIFSKLDEGELIFKNETVKTRSHRFFNLVENKIFSVDAKGYLLLLRELGLLNDLDIDLVIERVILSGYQKINILDLKKFISSFILNTENKSDILSRMILQNNDTIN
jgi:Smg protein